MTLAKTGSSSESVEDREGLLAAEDHMRDMDRLAMQVVGIARPFPGVARVTGRIAPPDAALWMPPNQAIRIEVETPAEGRAVTRIYTVRSFDPAASTIEIDFVEHEDDSPAMRWLRATCPGDTVWLIGPRPHFQPAHVPGKRAALLADETAIPALYALLSQWPVGAPAEIWVESCQPAAFAELPQVEGVTLHLLQRTAGEAAGTTGRLFASARAALTDASGWTLWAAGERQEMRALRSHFHAAGIPRDEMRILGYWKLGTSSSDLDRQRLKEYESLRARGLRMEDLSEADLPI